MGPAGRWAGPRGPDLVPPSHRCAGHHNSCRGRTWGPGPRRTSTSMGRAQKSEGLLPSAQGETREGGREREKRRVRECRESEHRDRREGRSEDRQPPSWEVIIHPKPGPMDLLFPWQPRAGKPLLRSCLATDAGDGVEDHELCP